jgi:hypothetical protein
MYFKKKKDKKVKQILSRDEATWEKRIMVDILYITYENRTRKSIDIVLR